MEQAIKSSTLDTTALTGEAALQTYAELRNVFGKGDAACVAFAEANNCFVATDDRRMQKKSA
jgi:predicted nucleic acid-binding protein